MRIYYHKDRQRFEAVADYKERDILKGNGFRWDTEVRIWHTSNHASLEGLPLDESANDEIRRSEERSKLSRATDSNVSLRVPEGLEYRPYQKAGIVYGVQKLGVIIADQRGLGKTIQAIGILNNIRWYTCLIVSPAKLQRNWRRELDKWLTREGKIVQSSWDSLHKIQAEKFDIVIFDEAHYAKNMKSRRGKAFLSIQSRRVVLLSGTPRKNKTIELFPLLHKIRPDLFPSWYKFAVRYCKGKKTRFGFQAEGSSNEGELNELLRRECMVRRMLVDVEKEIPPINREVVFVEPGRGLSGILKKYDNLLDADLEAITRGIPFEEMAAMRRAIIDDKLPAILDRIANQEEGDPLVVFAWHRDIIDQIYEAFPDRNPVKVVGGMTDKAAQNSVDSFQEGRSDLIIGNTLAMGEGHTLTRANQMIIAEWPWEDSSLEQMEGRINRITQTRATFIEYFAIDRSIESRMLQLCVEKAKISGLIFA